MQKILFAAVFLWLAAALPLAAQAPHGHAVATGTKTLSLPHRICPDKIALDITARYPKDTGNAQVDKLFEKVADDFVKKTAADAKADVLGKDLPCGYSSNLYANLTFKASKPDPYVLGVLLTREEFLGGAHPSYAFEAYNFDLATGKEIPLKTLFPNTKDGISKVYAFAYNDLCHKTARHEAARGVLGGVCGKDTSAPAALRSLSGGLGKLGNMVLTEKGAILSFHAYEIWSGAEGPLDLAIPAHDLVAMGAHDYWGAGAQGKGDPKK
jgi:hypothetical protein